MTVSVCIPTRNRHADLARCLEAIAASTVMPDEVIVADDGDGAAAVCAAAPFPVRCVVGPRRGVAANRNAAVAAAGGDFVTFLDDDCLIGPEFIRLALEAIEHAESVHGRGQVIVTGSYTEAGRIVWEHDQSFLGFQSVPYQPGATLFTIAMSAVVFPRAVFARVPFDERLRYGYEESDIASRAVAAGYVIVSCHEARNDHRPSPDSREDYRSVEQAARFYATFKRYYWTERRRGRAAAFALIAPLHGIAGALRRGDRRRLATILASTRVAAGQVLDYRRAGV